MTSIAVVQRFHRPRGRTGEVLYDPLRVVGVDAQLVPDGAPALDGVDLVWIFGSVNWYPKTWHRLLSLPAGRRPAVILWHTEPLPLPAAAGIRLERRHVRELAKIALRDPRRTDPKSNLRALRRLLSQGMPDFLAVSTRERQLFLAEHGIESEFVPLGYDPETHGWDLGLERDLDVLFLGALDVPRRDRVLRFLRRTGVDVRAIGDWNDPACFGEARTALLNRTKILLNLARHPAMLSGARMLLGMANKALVLAEPIYTPDPYRPGVHYVSAELADWPETIAHWLQDHAARGRVTDEAYEFIRTSVTMRESVTRILALAGVPVPGPAAVGR
jgi:hypothetical protein